MKYHSDCHKRGYKNHVQHMKEGDNILGDMKSLKKFEKMFDMSELAEDNRHKHHDYHDHDHEHHDHDDKGCKIIKKLGNHGHIL